MDLVVRVGEQEGWAVAVVSGDVDMTTAPRLREQVIEVITGGQPNVVLDLEEVDFIDSTGLGVVVGLLKRTRTHGGDLRLVSTRATLRKILELTALDQALPLAPDVDAAIGGVNPSGG